MVEKEARWLRTIAVTGCKQYTVSRLMNGGTAGLLIACEGDAVTDRLQRNRKDMLTHDME